MFKNTLVIGGFVGLVAGVALADSMADDPNVNARHAQMNLYAYNMSILGGMAKDPSTYDADLAKTTAENLVLLSKVDQSTYWPEGTDTSMEGSRALPAIWEDMADFEAQTADLVTAAEQLAASAGDGAEALQAGMGGVGQACGSCHKAYRQPKN